MTSTPDHTHQYLRQIRAAVRGMTTAEERDYLWSVVEAVYRPASSYHRWKMVMPSIPPQQMRALDVLYRRLGHNVMPAAIYAAAVANPTKHGDELTDDTIGFTVRRLIHELRVLFAGHQLPFMIRNFDGGYTLMQIGPWEPPFADFDKT